MALSNYQVVFHAYNNTAIGHVNIEFVRDGIRQGWYGSNIDNNNPIELGNIKGGIYEETSSSLERIKKEPNNHAATTITVSESNYQRALQHAKNANINTINGNGDYNLITGNCVDFSNTILSMVLPSTGWKLFDNARAQDYIPFNNFTSIYAATVASVAQIRYDIAMFNDVIMDDMMRNLRILMEGKKKFKCVIPYVMDIAEESIYCYWASPLAIDLNGDGVHTISLDNSNSTFSIRKLEQFEKSGWLSPQDGFIAIDSNNNGRIDDINELFGGRLGEGFAKLALLDTNQDGLINQLDDYFDKLLIWQDVNGDGISQPLELHTLSSLSISELSLKYNNDSFMLENGNIIGETSTATINNNSTALVDIYFQTASKQLLKDDYPNSNIDDEHIINSQPDPLAQPDEKNLEIMLTNRNYNPLLNVGNSDNSNTNNHNLRQIQIANSSHLYDTDVAQFVQAMSAFAPPAATQTSWVYSQQSNGQVLLAVNH